MMRILLILFLALSLGSNLNAAVEIQLAGDKEPVLIRSVYQRDGTIFLPLREILPPLHLVGVWDGAKRLYWISAKPDPILLAPGSRTLRYGKHSLVLKQAPRFFAGELCVPEEVLTTHLPRLLGLEITYVNHDAGSPPNPFAENEEGTDPATAFPLQQIVIDPGHGGDDPGAISPGGVKEKDLTLALALRLEKLLKMAGSAPVQLTRDGDYAVSLQQRAGTIRGAAAANLLISLHVSAWKSSETRGCTLYLLPLRSTSDAGEDRSLILAQSLVVALHGAGITDCSIERAPLFPLSRTPSPAVLMELGYLTNPEELSLLASSEGQERVARALALGVKNYAENWQRRTTNVPVTQ